MQHKPVILHIVRSMDGGIGKHIDALAQAAKDSGDFKTALVTSNPSSAAWYQHCWALKISDSPGLSDLKNLWRLGVILRSIKGPHVIVHGHGAKGGLYARLLKLFFRNKIYVIYTPHGGSLHRIFSPLKSSLYDFIEKSLRHLTDQFVFESDYTRTLFFKHVSKVPRYSINYNGVNPSETPKQIAYQPGTPLKLTSFGLYRELKGHDIAIKACALLKKNNIPFTYEIFGEGPLRPFLEELIANLQLSEQVKLRGYTMAPLDEMRRSDVVIHPSRVESFGYVPLEAMSLKIPVITSFNTGLKDYMTDAIGFIAYENEPQQYYAILKSLYEGTLDPKERIEHAYLWLRENMSEQAMKTRAIATYRACYQHSFPQP